MLGHIGCFRRETIGRAPFDEGNLRGTPRGVLLPNEV